MNHHHQTTSRRRNSDSVGLIDMEKFTPIIGVTSVIALALMWLGQIRVLSYFLAAVFCGLLCWAWRIHVLYEKELGHFARLRQMVRLQKEQQEEAGSTGTISPVFLFLVAAFLSAYAAGNLANSWKQFHASELAVVPGTITRREIVDVDMGSSLELEYEYQVGGSVYAGNRLRFVYRAFRVGTDDAKRLAATWKLGNQVSVYCDPDAPSDCVLDNTFCKGDELQVGLDVLLLLASILVVAGTVYYQLQRPRAVRVLDSPDGTTAIPLANVPFYGTVAMFGAAGALILTLATLYAGRMMMGAREIPWLVRTIDCLSAFTSIAVLVASMIWIVERMSFGRNGRRLVIDKLRKTISFTPESIGDTVSIDLGQLKTLRVVSNREDFFGRPFSVVASFSIPSGQLVKRIIERSSSRRYAFNLASAINRIAAIETTAARGTEDPPESSETFELESAV